MRSMRGAGCRGARYARLRSVRCFGARGHWLLFPSLAEEFRDVLLRSIAGSIGLLPSDIGNAEFEAEFFLDGLDLAAHPRIRVEMHIGQILVVSVFLAFG